MGKYFHTCRKRKRKSNKPRTALASAYLEDQTARHKKRHVTIKLKDEEDDEFVEARLSKNILAQARAQQEELEEDLGTPKKITASLKTVSLGPGSSHDDTSESDEELNPDDTHYEPIIIKEEDEKALEMFMSTNPPARRTLADIIMEKITEKQTEIKTQLSDNASVQIQQLDPRVVKMYKSLRQILQRYRSGSLPKAFKIIPSLRNWEHILYLTEPDKWSAASVYQATRIFVSNLNAKMTQRYFSLVLYPRLRDDIAEYKRLNFHLYMSVQKSLFKPSAFFKGILLPLCESGDCTLREAIIMSSILAKCSIPMLHSAAAILKIAEMDYNGANSIFLKALLDKKYALPFRVVDAVVHHFLRFQTDKRELPVLWHQSFLTFAQRYKEDISSEQKECLLALLRAQIHPGITPEIRRELMNSKCRDEEDAEPQIGTMELE